MRLSLSICILLLVTPVAVFAQDEAGPARWPTDLWDPAAEGEAGPADLVLPMPCGAAMAFQRVDVPVDPANPLDDRQVRLGQSEEQTGYSDYLRVDYLRGAFTDPAQSLSYYYIARYELTEGQYRSLSGDCAEPTRKDRLARGGISWFEAVDISRRYSEWLLANAPGQLPREEDAVGTLRLPSETEWEYAVRGGIRTDASLFPGRHFFAEGTVSDFGLIAAAGSARGKLGAVGLRRPNPLGLFDVYGNAEELMLEPYRFNVVGRLHGQLGGLVTRGRSVLAGEAEVYSAARDEYPFFSSATGQALAADTFGLRLVLSTTAAASDARLGLVKAEWGALATGAGTSQQNGDAVGTLAAIVAQELDPQRKRDLAFVLHEMRLASEKTVVATQAALASTLLAGAVIIETLAEDARQLDDAEYNLGVARDNAAVARGERLASLNQTARRLAQSIKNRKRKILNSLISYRSALATLSADPSPEQVTQAAQGLSADLSANGQLEILRLTRRFLIDVEVYRNRPDMDIRELQALAMSQD